MKFCASLSVTLNTPFISLSNSTRPEPSLGSRPTLIFTAFGSSFVNLSAMKFPAPQSVANTPVEIYLEVPLISPFSTIKSSPCISLTGTPKSDSLWSSASTVGVTKNPQYLHIRP